MSYREWLEFVLILKRDERKLTINNDEEDSSRWMEA